MSQPRVRTVLRHERTSIAIGLTLEQKDLLAKAATKEGKLLVPWLRELGLKAARGI